MLSTEIGQEPTAEEPGFTGLENRQDDGFENGM